MAEEFTVDEKVAIGEMAEWHLGRLRDDLNGFMQRDPDGTPFWSEQVAALNSHIYTWVKIKNKVAVNAEK